MIGPFERAYTAREWRTLTGTVEMDAGTHTVHARLLAGEAQLEYIEEFDTAITQFGVDQPVRYVNERRRIRLTIEAELDGMEIRFDPKQVPDMGERR